MVPGEIDITMEHFISLTLSLEVTSSFSQARASLPLQAYLIWLPNVDVEVRVVRRGGALVKA